MKKKFIMGGLAAIAACIVHAAANASPWVYLPSESVISNNNEVGSSTNYVLNVKVLDADSHTLSVGNGARGSAYRQYGGDTLDLSERIEDADGTQWMIEELTYDCLRDGSAPFVNIVFPRELKSSVGQQLNNRPAPLESVVLDCPEWEGVLDSFFLTSVKTDRNGKHVVVNLPKISQLNDQSFQAYGNVSDWNFDGVEVVNGSPFYYAHMTGTLRFPNIVRFGSANKNGFLMDRVELGNGSCSLAEVPAAAFCNSSWYRVTTFVLGGAKGWTVGSEAFQANGFQRVYMVGAMPTFADEKVAFGMADAAEKTMVFYIPKDIAEWQGVADSATPLTEDEIAAFKADHPDWDVPFAVVSADVFHTASPQYLGWIENRGDLGVTKRLSIGNRSKGQYDGDVVSVTVDGVAWDGGRIPLGSKVAVRAGTDGDHTRISWEGKLPDGTTPTEAEFTFTMTEADDPSLFVRFSHPWEYDDSTTPKTISDGYWMLVVSESDSASRELRIGDTSSSRADGRTAPPWAFLEDTGTYRGKKGECDLTGAVYAKGHVGEDDYRWTIVSGVGQAFMTKTAEDEVITSFYAPETLLSWSSQTFNASGSYSGSLTNVVIRCPKLTGRMEENGYGFSREPIVRMVLAVPNVTQFGGDSLNFGKSWWGDNVTFADTDLSEWDLSGLKVVGKSAFMVPADSGFGPTGELDLPNLETVKDAAFYQWTRHSSAALGTNGTLKSLGSMIFQNNTTALKKLNFGTSHDFTTQTDTFLATETAPLPIEEVWFAGPAPSVETLDNILALQEEGADGSKPVKMYVPMMKASWKAVRSPVAANEAAAAAKVEAATGQRVVGVYQTSDGRRVAWLVQNPNFSYTPGLKIVIR